MRSFHLIMRVGSSNNRSSEGLAQSFIVTHLEFPSRVKFLQALHSLLSVHHGCYSGALL